MDVAIFSVTQWLVLFLLTCLILVSVNFYLCYGYWERRGVPYVKPFLFFGNLSFVMRKSFWDVCYELKKNYPQDYIGMFLGWKPALMVQSTELAHKITVKDHQYFQNRSLYSNSSDQLGSLNLFTLKNPMWKTMRHEMSPMLTSARLKGITQLMNVNSVKLVQKIERDYIEAKKPVNLKELFTMYTSDTVAFNVFGIRVSALSDEDSPVWLISNHIVKWTFWRGLEFSLIFLMPTIAALLRFSFFSKSANEYIKSIFWNVVDQRRQSGKLNDKDLVTHLLKLKENLKISDERNPELADNLMLAQAAVFILGSIETSSATLSYALHELAYHQEEQEILYEEIIEAIKRSGKDVLEYNELVEMKYLTSCIFETLRKYPPVPYLDRIASENYKLTDDLTIDKGVPVFVNVVGIHYDETVYPQPEQWRPERMNPSTDNDNFNFNFLPFGEGPRFCIGKRYGLMQVRTALVHVIQKYKIMPGAPYSVGSDPYSVMLAPSDGGVVQFVPR